MRFITILILSLTGQLIHGQAKPGLYLTMGLDMEFCDHKMKLINTESLYCISGEPVVEVGLFDKVEEMVYDSLVQMRKFHIELTVKGKDFISTLSRKLPDHDLGLVVDGVLVSMIELKGVNYAGIIVIWDRNDSQAMEWLHRSLVKSVTQYNKKS
jgi:hypothetical protein